MKIIDCNVLLGPSQFPTRYNTAQGLMEYLDDYRISFAVVCHSAAQMTPWVYNAEMSCIADKSGGRILPCHMLDPMLAEKSEPGDGTLKERLKASRPGIEAIKAELKKYGEDEHFVGIKLLPGYHGSLTQKEYQYAADFANEKACIVITHTWGNDPQLSEVDALAEKRKRMKLLCAHQGGGAAPLSYKLAEIMRYRPNISIEICGSLSNTLSIEDLVALAGEDRVVYGSDLINLDVRYDFGRVVFSTLDDNVKVKLLSGNFLRHDQGFGNRENRHLVKFLWQKCRGTQCASA